MEVLFFKANLPPPLPLVMKETTTFPFYCLLQLVVEILLEIEKTHHTPTFYSSLLLKRLIKNSFQLSSFLSPFTHIFFTKLSSGT